MRGTAFALALLTGLLTGAMLAGDVAHAAGPPDGFKLKDDYNAVAPDKATTVEQYSIENKDGDTVWQFWARRSDSFVMLPPDQADYPADFRFTNDSTWLVRLQKTGSGEGTMYLYHLTPKGFVTATKKPIGDLAWAYFNSRPESKKVPKPDLHIYAGLLKGIADNYKSMGGNWPDSRYIVIGLSGDLDPTPKHHQLLVVRGWMCRYDLTTGKFDVPDSFAKDNAEALAKEGQAIR
jgi:hypothetical protein